MSEKIKERTTLESKAIKINEKLLTEICEVLDKQNLDFLQKEKEDKYYSRSLEYSLITKNKKIETENSNSFLKNWNAKNFKEIKMFFRAEENIIHVRLGGIYERLECDVESLDSMWVNGLIKRFEEIFEKYETKNEFFHSRSAYIIYVGIPVALSAGFLSLLGPILPEGELEDLPFSEVGKSAIITLIFVVTVATSFFWGELFRWLFPKIETENMIQIKIRKIVLGGIGAIFVTLIAGGIFSFIQSLSG